MIIMLLEAHYDDNGNDMNFVVRVKKQKTSVEHME